MVAAALPDLDQLDAEALKALLIAGHNQLLEQRATLAALHAELDEHRQTLTAQSEQLRSSSERIEHLKLLVDKMRHMIFGKKSEKVVVQLEQLEFQLEDLESTQAEAEAMAEAAAPANTPVREQKARPARKPLPSHLPREVVSHLPSGDCCPDCGGALRQFGEDVTEQLEYIPESFKVIRHVRPKFACNGCDRVVEAPAPSRPIERGIAGPGLLAHVLVSKFADHLPLYRQSEIYARQGVEIERSTLAGWVGASSELLSPLVAALHKHVLAASKLHADDTPIPVLAPGNGKTKTGRLWTYVRDDRPAGEDTPPAVWFAYSPDRKGEHPRQHLKNFKGALQADAYSGFHHLYGEGRIYEVACWAHARRKFHDIHVIHASPTTTEALARIGALYGIEEEVRGKPPSCGERFDRPAPGRCSMSCTSGWKRLCDPSRPRARPRARFATRSRDGAPSRATPTTAVWRSTTRPPSARCALWLWDGRTFCLPAPTAVASAPPTSTRSSDRPSSTGSTRNSTSARSSPRSPNIPSAASMNCCPGTWHLPSRPTLPRPPDPHLPEVST
jgi:transposase